MVKDGNPAEQTPIPRHIGAARKEAKPWRNDDADLLLDAAKIFAANPSADRRDILLGLARTFHGWEMPEAVADRLLGRMEAAWQDPRLIAAVEGAVVRKAAEQAEVELEVADGVVAMQAQRRLKGLPEMGEKALAGILKGMEQAAWLRRYPKAKTMEEVIAEE